MTYNLNYWYINKVKFHPQIKLVCSKMTSGCKNQQFSFLPMLRRICSFRHSTMIYWILTKLILGIQRWKHIFYPQIKQIWKAKRIIIILLRLVTTEIHFNYSRNERLPFYWTKVKESHASQHGLIHQCDLKPPLLQTDILKLTGFVWVDI